MSEQDDFLMGNNRLDESLLMDMSNTPVEQSAVKPANRRKKAPAKRNASSTANRKGSGTAKRSNGVRQPNISDGASVEAAGRSAASPSDHSRSQPVEQLNVEPANQRNGGLPAEDAIDIDGLLMDPWGDSPDVGQDMESFAYGTGSPVFQPDGGQADQQSIELDSQQNSRTAERSNGEMFQHSEIGTEPYSDRGAEDLYAVTDGTDAVAQADLQDDIWEEDGPQDADVGQSAQPDRERFDQSDEDVWNTGIPAEQENGIAGSQQSSLPAFRSDGETDIWDDFASGRQADPSMMEQPIPKNSQSGVQAKQSNSATEPRRDSEPDIWSGGEPVEQETLAVAYDDVWDEEIPVLQPDADSGTAEQEDGETVKQPDGDFFQRNSIFDGARANGGEAGSATTQLFPSQTGDTEIWNSGETAEQEDGATVDLYSCFPSQQFDADSGLPGYDGHDDADTENDGKAKRIVLKAAVILAGVALLCGGGYFAYSTYSRMRDENTSWVESQQELDSLVKAQEEWEEKVAEAKELIAEIKDSVVKDDESVADECDKLSDATEGSPMSEDAAKKKLDALSLQYDATDSAYRKALQSKSEDVSDKLKTLVEQAEKLGDAPDSSDKETMNGLVEQWKGKTVTSDNVADVNKAVASLQSAVDKVSKAKTDAENAKREEEERKKAEEEAQQQQEAQQQAQQQTQQQQYTYTYTPQQQTQQQSQPQQQSQSQQSQSPSTGSDGNSGVMF